MHELSIADQIISMVELEAKEAQAVKVSSVTIDVSVLMEVEEDNLQFCLNTLKKEYLLTAETIFIYREVPVEFECLSCGEKVIVSDLTAPVCQECGSSSLDIRGGDSIYIAEMEVEIDESGSTEKRDAGK